MLIAKLTKQLTNIHSKARNLCYSPLKIGGSDIPYNFAKIKQILNATKNIKDIDTLKLDSLCEKTLLNYELKSDKSNNTLVGDNIAIKQKQEQSVIQIYRLLSSLKIGLLKGDIHSESIYKLDKMAQEKYQKHNKLYQERFSISKKNMEISNTSHEIDNLENQINRKLGDELEITQEEGKAFLEDITDYTYFRLPKKGIKRHQRQDKNNLYQRQLLLEETSNEQAYEKFDTILESLKKLGKVHLSDCLRKYMIEWFSPLCRAIKEEQKKCNLAVNDLKKQSRSSSLGDLPQSDQKQYAQYFLKLSPERLTSVCISQLMKQITKCLFRGSEDQSGFQAYPGIKYQSFCLNLAKWVSIQTAYEKQQARFKEVMKVYDTLFKEEKKRRQIERNKEKQKEEQKNNMPKTQAEIQYEEIQKEANQLADDYELNQSDYAQIFQKRIKEITLSTGYRFIKPEDRKNFLLDLAGRLSKNSRCKQQMPEQIQFYIGSILIYLMKEIIRVQNKSGYKVPLLSLQHKLVKRQGDVLSLKLMRINEHFLNTIQPQIQKQSNLMLHLDRSLPTIIKPMPWIQYEIGGYYLRPSTVMRFSNCKVQEELIKYGDISRVYNVLNYLGGIGWKINKKILNVVEKIWEEGGQIGEIPKRYSQMVGTYVDLLKREKNPNKIKLYSKKIQELRDQHSLRSDFNLKLNIARSYSKMDKFFYPHNLDFRGRVYPIPPHMNHIGNDLSRGLLTFADGRKLKKTGLKWLKIHCANLMGKDKATIPEKLQFTEANLNLIKDIATDPLKNREWASFEDCWQALSAIFQLNDALSSPNPQQFVSCLHIHQDGSCNGLQHYAAMGRDIEGAYQVSLGPTQRPGDVYTHVAKMVIKMIDEDIANPESTYHQLAKKLNNNIKRKTIKQTVMTSVYGVTFIGARDQIHRQLKDQKFLIEEQQFRASNYVAKLTLQAISNLFSRAHLIKKWLISCAKVVTDTGNPMGWITPMGLPVVQPYRTVSMSDQVSTIVQKLKLSAQSSNLPVNKAKQKSAFPPNFVHSLDSTHMMYTAERCMKLGLTFAAVHDSYWTHAGNVQQMNQILREQFVRLHSEPLLQNLKSSLQKRYMGIEFPEIPDRGEFDLKKIKESVYFFS